MSVAANVGSLTVSGTTLSAGYPVAAAEGDFTTYVATNLVGSSSSWSHVTGSGTITGLATITWSGSSGAWICSVTPLASTQSLFVHVDVLSGASTVMDFGATSVKFTKLVIGDTEYTVTTNEVNGKLMLVLQ